MTLPPKVPHGKVRLLPLPSHYIPGVPHAPQDVDPERAAELLAYTPPAFRVEDPEPVPVVEPPKPPKE